MAVANGQIQHDLVHRGPRACHTWRGGRLRNSWLCSRTGNQNECRYGNAAAELQLYLSKHCFGFLGSRETFGRRFRTEVSLRSAHFQCFQRGRQGVV